MMRFLFGLPLCVLAWASCGGGPQPRCTNDGECGASMMCSASLCQQAKQPLRVHAVEKTLTPGQPPFAMYGGDLGNTGRVAGTISQTQPTELWRFETGGPIVGAPTVGPDGTVYLTSHDGFLYALNSDGTLKWKQQTGDRIWGTPAVSMDGTIYIGSDDDHLYAFSPKGHEKWKLRLGNCKTPQGFGPEGTLCDVDGGPKIAKNGLIYTGGDGVYAVTAEGKIYWKFATREHVSSAVAQSSDGTIYAGSLEDALFAIGPDGIKKWEYRVRRDVDTAPSVGDDGHVYFGTDDNAIYALKPDGELKWKVITGDDVRASVAIGPKGRIFVGSYDRSLYAIDPDGNVAWKFTTAGKIHGPAVVDPAGTVLFGSQDDHVYTLSRDGRLLWFIDMEGDVDAPVTVDRNGKIYIAGDKGVLRVFGKAKL